MSGRRAALPTLILLLALVCAALAQEVLSYHGRVLWIQGTKMAFAPDIEGNVGGSFEVDLSKVDQTSYEFLKSGDKVTVVGVVTEDGQRLIAESITAD